MMNSILLSHLANHQLITLAAGQVKVAPAPGGWHLFTPYHQDFVEDLKTQIPPRARRFDQTTKAWWVSEPYLTAAVLDILAVWFDPELRQALAEIRAEMPPAIEEIATI